MSREQIEMTRYITFILACLAVFLLSSDPAIAKNNKKSGVDCPPGLAKKNPPCVPPGHAKRGDWIGNYPHIVLDPNKHRLDARYGWYKLGDDLYVRTDRETGEIIELFNAIAAVLD